ncbi:MAG: hypothetical protein AAB215_02090, partial [Planctomycetota bacterium]
MPFLSWVAGIDMGVLEGKYIYSNGEPSPTHSMAVHLIAEISKARVRRNFDRAAASYAPEAGIQRTLAATLAAWEPPPEACPERPVLDLGAGTG